ncbi:MAG: CBS domain-containing protein [Kiritimatiellales bacterium]
MTKVRQLLEAKGGDLITVSPESSVRDAIAKMAQKSAGTALVMEDGKLAGILSERDFIRKVYLKNKDGAEVKVSDIMSADLTTVTPDTGLENCMESMTEKRIRHLPVIENEQVVGIISIGDIVKFTIQEKEFLIKNLQSYIAGFGL